VYDTVGILTLEAPLNRVWSVAYNKFHDQLVLTSSSDCQVNLQSIVSISTGADYQYGEISDAEDEDTDKDDDAQEQTHPEYVTPMRALTPWRAISEFAQVSETSSNLVFISVEMQYLQKKILLSSMKSPIGRTDSGI